MQQWVLFVDIFGMRESGIALLPSLCAVSRRHWLPISCRQRCKPPAFERSGAREEYLPLRLQRLCVIRCYPFLLGTAKGVGPRLIVNGGVSNGARIGNWNRPPVHRHRFQFDANRKHQCFPFGSPREANTPLKNIFQLFPNCNIPDIYSVKYTRGSAQVRKGKLPKYLRSSALAFATFYDLSQNMLHSIASVSPP